MKQAQVPGMDPERLASIPIRMNTFVEKGTIAGAVTLVARHGVVASLEAVGHQHLETKTPMRTDTIFQIRSMTKPVTAVAVMTLIEEGRLGLLDPVEKHLPEFREMSVIASREGDNEPALKQPSRAITIRDLMSHTSGMLNAPGPADGDWKNWLLTWTKRTMAEKVAMCAQKPLDSDPGTNYQYSNGGYYTLGRIIEVVSEQPYEEFIAERIFEPLGMKDSSFFPPPEKFDRIASPYRPVEGKLKKTEDELRYLQGRKNPSPGWGILATASDLLAFHQMMLNGGTYNGRRILSRPSVELMTQVHTGELYGAGPRGPELASYGLGWRVVPPPAGRHSPNWRWQMLRLMSPGAYGHGGYGGAFGWVDRKKDLIGIFLIQVFPDAGSPDRYPEELHAFMAMAAAAIAD